MSNKTTVETVRNADIKAGDTILRESGDRTVVAEVTSCAPFLLRYRDTNGTERYSFSDCALRVVPDEPAAEEPVWPGVDFIRIIRGTENGDRIDGSLAHRIGSQRSFRLQGRVLRGPRLRGGCDLRVGGGCGGLQVRHPHRPRHPHGE